MDKFYYAEFKPIKCLSLDKIENYTHGKNLERYFIAENIQDVMSQVELLYPEVDYIEIKFVGYIADYIQAREHLNENMNPEFRKALSKMEEENASKKS